MQPMQLSNSTSSYKRKQSNFTEVADLLDEIEEFENGTLEINESIAPIPIASFIMSRNSKCNNNELKAILIKNIGEDLNTTKRMIQLIAKAKFGGHFNVICSKHNFSFLTNTELFCQAIKVQVKIKNIPSTICQHMRQLA
uniref:Ground-like domain-containing protein n=1 Tax=Onchocerca volvulus TaxID=6282 RepID=A0A8R1TYL0_ONCVO